MGHYAGVANWSGSRRLQEKTKSRSERCLFYFKALF
jgi:hypothetical protein